MNRLEMQETLKRIRNVPELPKELLEEMQREMPDGEPVWQSIINFMTQDELNMEEERIFEEVETKDEEDLHIYREEDLTEEEQHNLPSGSLMREKDDGPLLLKVLDIWTQYSGALKKPEEPLTKYGLMRRNYLEEWKARTALEWDKDILIHCLEVQREAQEMKHRLMEDLTKGTEMPDRKSDPMGWVRRMNALDAQAEEIVTSTLIYPEAARESVDPIEEEYWARMEKLNALPGGPLSASGMMKMMDEEPIPMEDEEDEEADN